MKERRETSKIFISILIVFAVCAVLVLGTGYVTSPFIRANMEAGNLEPLFNVLPGSKGFDIVYKEGNADSLISDVPATVKEVFADQNGAGYAINLTTTDGYTGNPMDITLGIGLDGKITGAEVITYPDTKYLGDEYPLSYIGQDSTLADAEIVAGVTYSSSAFKNAVADAFKALIDKGLVGAGEKGASQLLLEQIGTLCPAMVNAQGVAQFGELEVRGSITKAMKEVCGNGAAFLIGEGEDTCLAVTNLDGSCRVYDVDGKDITETVEKTVIDDCLAITKENCPQVTDKDLKKILKLVSDTAEAVQVPLDGVFNGVSDAFLITDAGQQYYGFAVRTYGYSNLPFLTCFILDSSGAIVTMIADEFILEEEYFTAYTLDKQAYKDGFSGLTKDSYTGEQAIISGATVSSNAIDMATKAVFQAYDIVSGNSNSNAAEVSADMKGGAA